MKTQNEYYVDDNGNKWSISLETEKSAEKKSKSLVNCKKCIDCHSCDSCDYCNFCNFCNSCNSCKNFKENPCRYVTDKIGSRAAQTYFYWTKELNQVVCGCWKGTIDEFGTRVKDNHKDHPEFLSQYLNEIKKVKYLMK